MNGIFLALIAAAILLSAASIILNILILSRTGRGSSDKEFSAVKSELNGRLDSMQSNIVQNISQTLKISGESQLNQSIKLSQEIQNSLNSFASQVTGLTQSMDLRMAELRKAQDEKLETVRSTMETRISAMQGENEKKLDQIRQVVDEKLQKTLNERVSESFKIVEERLEQVYKGLGEMQTLATGVGDLKRILTNVKTRGVFGEVQLERILEQILTNDQYEKNVKTKQKSNDLVEFAIKLPAKGEYDPPVYLPIDAKFPMDKYTALLLSLIHIYY